MDQNQNDEKPRVLDVEIIEPDGKGGKKTWYYHSRSSDGASQTAYSGYFSSLPMGGAGCLAPFVTACLFFFCLGNYGLLAGIGFFVFHVIGAIMGSIQQARQLMLGLPASPWPWRVGNWIISFLLTVWLAGGFHE